MIHGLKELNISINRKVLADMAINDPTGFARLAGMARERIAVPA
jgi:large subunit ribosomal protein L20